VPVEPQGEVSPTCTWECIKKKKIGYINIWILVFFALKSFTFYFPYISIFLVEECNLGADDLNSIALYVSISTLSAIFFGILYDSKGFKPAVALFGIFSLLSEVLFSCAIYFGNSIAWYRAAAIFMGFATTIDYSSTATVLNYIKSKKKDQTSFDALIYMILDLVSDGGYAAGSMIGQFLYYGAGFPVRWLFFFSIIPSFVCLCLFFLYPDKPPSESGEVEIKPSSESGEVEINLSHNKLCDCEPLIDSIKSLIDLIKSPKTLLKSLKKKLVLLKKIYFYDPTIRYWSIINFFMAAAWLNVENYIQGLWLQLTPNSDNEFNGYVDATFAGVHFASIVVLLLLKRYVSTAGSVFLE
jgi:MFS family permease